MFERTEVILIPDEALAVGRSYRFYVYGVYDYAWNRSSILVNHNVTVDFAGADTVPPAVVEMSLGGWLGGCTDQCPATTAVQ